jgi:predicted Zn-dependent peptidase
MTIHYFKDVLPSGLRVVTVEAPHLHTAMISMYVRTGSRHERDTNNGVSHFLEHMFFRGSTSFPDTLRMNAAVEEVGGNLNGVTTRDHGYYFTPLHPGHLQVAIQIIGDMLARPLLREMELERQIILEEMLDEVDERGRDIDLDNLSKMELFDRHPLGLKIAGTVESVKALRLRQLRDHLERYYVSGNMVFAAAGKVERNEILELSAKSFGDLPAGPSSGEGRAPPLRRGPRFKYVQHDEAQTEFRLSFRTVPEEHPDFPALQILRRVLDDGLSSRLPQNVVEKKGLAYSVHAAIEAFSDVGLFDIEAASAPEKAALVLEEICRTIGELCSGGVEEEELNRAKRRHRMLLEFAQDSTADLAGWFGGTELFRTPETFEQRARQIDGQTAEQVQKVAQRYLGSENATLVAVGQRKGTKSMERVLANGHLGR